MKREGLRIAACLSGQGRTAHYCKPYLDRFFAGNQVDWFIHAWPEDSGHVGLFRPVRVSHTLPPDLLEKERRVIERFRNYSFIRTIPMYWGISEAIALVDPARYDLIVRVRPDIVPLQRLRGALCRFDDAAIHFAYHMQEPLRNWQPPQKPNSVTTDATAYNDLLFYGVPSRMLIFRSLYEHVDRYCNDPKMRRFTAGQVLSHFLNQQDFSCRRAPLALYLIDKENAKRPLAAYRRDFGRAATRKDSTVDYVAKRMPDLVEDFLRERTLTDEEKWFATAWFSQEGPRYSECARRLSQRRYEEVTVGRSFLKKMRRRLSQIFC